MALKLVVPAPFRFASDDGCRGAKTSGLSTISISKWRPSRCWRGVVELKLVLSAISMRKWRPSQCWLGVVALKPIVSAPFRFVSDDLLGVGGVSWR